MTVAYGDAHAVVRNPNTKHVSSSMQLVHPFLTLLFANVPFSSGHLSTTNFAHYSQTLNSGYRVLLWKTCEIQASEII